MLKPFGESWCTLLNSFFIFQPLDHPTDRSVIDSRDTIAFEIIIYLALWHGTPIEAKTVVLYAKHMHFSNYANINILIYALYIYMYINFVCVYICL